MHYSVQIYTKNNSTLNFYNLAYCCNYFISVPSTLSQFSIGAMQDRSRKT